MQLLNSYLKIFGSIIVLLFFFSCKKDKNKDWINVQLYDQPTQTVESYIEGRWRVHCMIGGFGGLQSRDNREQFHEYYTMLPGHRVIYEYQNNVVSDTTYTWTTYQGGTWDYVHNILRSRNAYFEVEKIYNDTLFLAEPFIGNPDYDRLLLTKEN